MQQNQIVVIVLQLRVNPGSYTVNKNTTKYDILDPHYTDDQLEWRIADPNDVFPYRILYKRYALADYCSFFVKKEKAKE